MRGGGFDANLIIRNQCDQIGIFLKVLAANLLTKEAQMISDFLGYFEKCHFLTKKGCDYFWVTIEKLGYILVQYLVSLYLGR